MKFEKDRSGVASHAAAFASDQAGQGRRGTAALLLAAAMIGILAVAAVHYLNRPVTGLESSTGVADRSTAAPPGGFKLALRSNPQPVPELRFADGKERPVSLDDFRGKTILLNIWASWCPPCRAEMPMLDVLQAKLGGSEFEVVPLSIDQGDSALVLIEEFFREVGVHHLPIYVDSTGEAASVVGSVGLPTTILIDRDGKEVGRLIGGAEWDSPEAIAFIEGRLAVAHQR